MNESASNSRLKAKSTKPSLLDTYKILVDHEQKTTQMRHATFVALISISFVVAGFASKADNRPITIIGYPTSLAGISFLLGFFFYLFAIFHYSWHHRYSHLYRKELKRLEAALGIRVYRLRLRPTWRDMKFHFDWSLYILGLLYYLAACAITGWELVTSSIACSVTVYALFLYHSRWERDEPLE